MSDFKGLILPGQDTRLLDKRFEEEDRAAAGERAFAENFTEGAPALPDAQLVFNQAKGTFGVAVRGARFVCELPKGYAKGVELAVIAGERLIATCPGQKPLLIDGQRGTALPLY